MESQNIEATKLNGMVMCGDHPSFTKTELNTKEELIERAREQSEKEERKLPGLYGRITPTPSRVGAEGHAPASERSRAAPPSRPYVPLLQEFGNASKGPGSWAPYLLCAWLLLLALGHALHCLAAGLARALPHARKVCQYFRTWTEESWKSETSLNQRAWPVVLACATALLYGLYCAVYVLHAVAAWAVEPLYEVEDKLSLDEIPKITNYVDEMHIRLNTNIKP